METKKWEAMLAAVELGSFTRAAARLDLTQSGLTHMMNALEKETGFPLLVRDRSGVRLTAAGERLQPAIHELLEAAAHLKEQIAAQAGQQRESIRVAAYSSTGCPPLCSNSGGPGRTFPWISGWAAWRRFTAGSRKAR